MNSSKERGRGPEVNPEDRDCDDVCRTAQAHYPVKCQARVEPERIGLRLKRALRSQIRFLWISIPID